MFSLQLMGSLWHSHESWKSPPRWTLWSVHTVRAAKCFAFFVKISNFQEMLCEVGIYIHKFIITAPHHISLIAIAFFNFISMRSLYWCIRTARDRQGNKKHTHERIFQHILLLNGKSGFSFWAWKKDIVPYTETTECLFFLMKKKIDK